MQFITYIAAVGAGGKVASVIALIVFGIAALFSIFGMRKVNRK